MQRKNFSKWTSRTLFAVSALILAMLVSAAPIFAQFDTGAVLGTITDSSGATANGATVTLANEGTTAAVSFTTGGDGAFKFTPVKVGTYKVTVTLAGFQTAVQRGISVNVGQSVVVDMALKPGAVSETVEVTAAAPVLQSQDASVGQVVDSRSVNNLPLNGRNFTFLAQIVAGVNSPQEDGRGNEANGAFSANGLRSAQNNYLLDGLDNNSNTVDFLNGTNFVILPPIDAIEEFKVQTSGFSAEFGRSGAAILNATIKSGTNTIHGAAWEFLRNDKFDASDFFENANGIKKGKYRYNEYGISAGGPVRIPKLFDGRNKVFFFADYQGTRVRQGSPQTGDVPTVAEVSSGFTDFADLITGQSGTRTDGLCAVNPGVGNPCLAVDQRSFPKGTIFDPATTRPVTAGTIDPVTGFFVMNTGFTRDPFGTCPVTTVAYTLAGCGLNQLPSGRFDANALALLKLFPSPTGAGIFNNFTSNAPVKTDRNAFDTRLDFNFNQSNQLFFRFSLSDDPQNIPGLFSGVADGGSFSQGNQTAIAEQSVLGFVHTFSPTLVNVTHAGITYLHTTRVSNEALNYTGTGGNGVPLDYGILGIPQNSENGGLPAFNIGHYAQLGGNAFLPSDEVSSTFQLTDDLTKVYGKHSFKMGFEWQHVKFSTLQPPWSHGQFGFGGAYTDIPGVGGGNTGVAQALLVPKASTVANGIDFVGGPSSVFVSNISLTDNGRNYYGGYFQDDWKVTSKLTLNLGVRWDYFQPVFEHHGAQANFVPSGAPTGSPLYLLPNSSSVANLSTSFTTLLAKDGIGLAAGKYGQGLQTAQKNNIAPRLGAAYQISRKLVARSSFGMFYDGFENRGFSPNLGESYPFQFNFSFFNPNDGNPINNFAGCKDATPAGGPTFETGFACTPLSPLQVNANGLGLRGIQYDYKTPYSMGGNLTLQYQLTPTMSIQAGYVGTFARHLEVFPNTNRVDQILPAGTDIHKQDAFNSMGVQTAFGQCPTENFPGHACIAFPDFGDGGSYATSNGSSYYHSLQTKVEKQFAGGLNFLATYTWSKVRTDAFDLLNGGNVGGYRAPGVVGIHNDYELGNADIRNVFHFSGNYELPFGKDKKFMSGASGITNKLIGGWGTVWLVTLQGGQPITIGCPETVSVGSIGCYAIRVKGQDPQLGLKTNAKGLTWINNPAAFTQPCKLGVGGTPIQATLLNGNDCVPLTGLAALGGSGTQIAGPGFHRLDFSIFKNIPITERVRMEFRSEFFNLTNHANFHSPSDLNFEDGLRFGQITSTRQPSTNPRQIQFALKLYY